MSHWLSLRSGCNPHQTPARASVAAGQFPITVRNGEPGFINLLDALGSWQLVCDLHAATDTVAAASFKHVTPAGAAVAAALGEDDARAGHLDPGQKWSLPAAAYARARGGDRLSSYGDWVAVSTTVDGALASLLAGEVSNGIIAPAYEPDAAEVLAAKNTAVAACCRSIRAGNPTRSRFAPSSASASNNPARRSSPATTNSSIRPRFRRRVSAAVVSAGLSRDEGVGLAA